MLPDGHEQPVKLSDGLVLAARLARTLSNLKSALNQLPYVWIFDNDDLSHPFRLVAIFENGGRITCNKPIPKWLKPLLP